MSSIAHLELTLNDTIQRYLDDFFLSLQGDSNSLQSFLGKLSTFNNTIRTHHRQLQKETLKTARNFVHVVSTVSAGVLSLQSTEENPEIMTDISKILNEEMGGLSINEDTSHPAYVKPAYHWLLSNLHNPYPSKEFKRDISRQSKCSVKDIDAWFIDTRKRIGWNKLRKTKFSNKQDKIVAAATYIFQPKIAPFSDDPTSPLISEMNPNDAFRSDFLTMASIAKALYSNRFPELASLESFDGLVIHPSNPTESTTKMDESKSQPPNPYPTPEPSPRSTDEDSRPSTPLPPLGIQSMPRKRRQPPLDNLQNGEEDSCSRPSKRIRSEEPTPITDANVVKNISHQIIMNTSQAQDTSTTFPVVQAGYTPSQQLSNLKRKRSLSDGENQHSAKRPHNALCVARLQTTSGPLPPTMPPVEDILDGWSCGDISFEHHLSDTIPLPANTEDPMSHETPLFVDLCQYEFSPYNPGLDLPAEIRNVDPSAPLSRPGNSKSFSIYDHLPVTGAPQGAGLGFIDTSGVQSELDPMSSYQLNFEPEQHNTAHESTIFPSSGLLSFAPGYLPYPSSLFNDFYGNLDSLDSGFHTHHKAPVLGNFNHAIQPALFGSEEKEVKRARAQALREELALYEAEGL